MLVADFVINHSSKGQSTEIQKAALKDHEWSANKGWVVTRDIKVFLGQ